MRLFTHQANCRRGYVVLGLLLLAPFPLAMGQHAVRAESLQQPTREMLEVYADIDGRVPADQDTLFESANALNIEFRQTLKKLHEELPAKAQSAGDAEILEGLQRLAEVRQRVRTIYYWTLHFESVERRALKAARVRAKAYNLEQVRRARAAFLAGIEARRQAWRNLRRLASGRARVVREDSYGNQTGATAAETNQYASNLAAFAHSPIWVPRPRLVKAKAFHTIEQLDRITQRQQHVRQLLGCLDKELLWLAPMHQAIVTACWDSGDQGRQVTAIASLGPWTSGKGRALLNKALSSDNDALRRAALASLPRMDNSAAALTRYVKHSSAEVRQVAVQLVADQIFKDRMAMKLVVRLLDDSNAGVRTAAYDAFDRLSALHEVPFHQQLRYVSAGRNRAPDDLMDAVHWIDTHGDATSKEHNTLKCEILENARRHHDDGVRQAATTALQGMAFGQ